MTDEVMRTRCSFPGCHRSTTRMWRGTDDWPFLASWGPGIPDGFYCKPHADALEALSDSGELDHIQSGAERN
jgi:hypothetical protein